MKETNNRIEAQLLVYTRTGSFDYNWIYGHKNLKIQRELENLFDNWITNKLLDDVSREVIIFTTIESNYVLLLASPSPNRQDSVRRPIFDRAALVIDSSYRLSYCHLDPLAKILFDESSGVYRDLLTDRANFKTEYHVLTILPELISESYTLSSEEFKNSRVSFEGNLGWKDVWKRNLIVKFPNKFNFGDTVQLIGKHPLEQTLHICYGIHADAKYLGRNALVVFDKSNLSDVVSVFDYSDHLIDKGHIEINKGTDNVPASSYKNKADANSQPEQTKQSVEKQEINDTALLNHLERLVKNVKQSDNPKNPIINRFLNLAEKISVKRRNHYIQPMTEILYLLTPVDGFIPPETCVLWNSLFNEIHLLHENASLDLRNHWRMRISFLKTVTYQSVDENKMSQWSAQFNKSCNELRELLTNTPTTETLRLESY